MATSSPTAVPTRAPSYSHSPTTYSQRYLDYGKSYYKMPTWEQGVVAAGVVCFCILGMILAVVFYMRHRRMTKAYIEDNKQIFMEKRRIAALISIENNNNNMTLVEEGGQLVAVPVKQAETALGNRLGGLSVNSAVKRSFTLPKKKSSKRGANIEESEAKEVNMNIKNHSVVEADEEEKGSSAFGSVFKDIFSSIDDVFIKITSGDRGKPKNGGDDDGYDTEGMNDYEANQYDGYNNNNYNDNNNYNNNYSGNNDNNNNIRSNSRGRGSGQGRRDDPSRGRTTSNSNNYNNNNNNNNSFNGSSSNNNYNTNVYNDNYVPAVQVPASPAFVPRAVGSSGVVTPVEKKKQSTVVALPKRGLRSAVEELHQETLGGDQGYIRHSYSNPNNNNNNNNNYSAGDQAYGGYNNNSSSNYSDNYRYSEEGGSANGAGGGYYGSSGGQSPSPSLITSKVDKKHRVKTVNSRFNMGDSRLDIR